MTDSGRKPVYDSLFAQVFEPRHEWRPWKPSFRMPLELGWRRFFSEAVRRVGMIVFVLLFLAALPVLVIVGIVVLFVVFLGAMLNNDPQDEPQPVRGMERVIIVEVAQPVGTPITPAVGDVTS